MCLQIRNCLDEYAEDKKQKTNISFSANRYKSKYKKYLQVLTKLNNNPETGLLIKENLCEWAEEGMYVALFVYQLILQVSFPCNTGLGSAQTMKMEVMNPRLKFLISHVLSSTYLVLSYSCHHNFSCSLYLSLSQPVIIPSNLRLLHFLNHTPFYTNENAFRSDANLMPTIYTIRI